MMFSVIATIFEASFEAMATKMVVLSRRLTFVPWQTSMTVQPIEQLLNAPAARQDEVIKAWTEAKLAELSFVGLAVR